MTIPRPEADRFEALVEKGEGCWIWKGHCNAKGYGVFSLRTGVVVLAHRWSYEHYVGPIPEGLNVLHRCDNPPCVRPDDLFTGTQADNMQDSIAKGRWYTEARYLGVVHRAPRDPATFQRGEDGSAAKLTWEQVREIRRGYLDGAAITALASQYGVGFQNVWHIIKGATWADPAWIPPAAGRRARDERNGGAKLTRPIVEEIRRLHALGNIEAVLSRQFAISKSQVGRIVRGESWR